LPQELDTEDRIIYGLSSETISGKLKDFDPFEWEWHHNEERQEKLRMHYNENPITLKASTINEQPNQYN
jgi:hypothetical protein